MYELANPIRIKEMPIFNISSCNNMMSAWLKQAYINGVNVPELYANIFVYDTDDMIFSVEYVKMICNLSIIFREIFDNQLYSLRLKGLISNEIYSNINFHNIFNEVNDKFNSYIDDQFLMYEFAIYHSEISLETSMAMYEAFSDTIINILKDTIDIKILQFIFNKHNMRYIQIIYEKIFLQLENVFSIYC